MSPFRAGCLLSILLVGSVSAAQFTPAGGSDAVPLAGGVETGVLRSGTGANGPSHFGTTPSHAALPTGAACASMIVRSDWEPRPQNASYNRNVPTRSALERHKFYSRTLYNGEAPTSDFATVDGNFVGTTDMIIRWSACKWGIDEDVLRAQAVEESDWVQSLAGDRRTDESSCNRPFWNGWDAGRCYQSYGLFQVKVYDYNAWPEASTSTAFNADFHGAYTRSCLNGDIGYLINRTNPETGNTYPAGSNDELLWGCIGDWFSGSWYDSDAESYISKVKKILAAKPWLRPSF